MTAWLTDTDRDVLALLIAAGTSDTEGTEAVLDGCDLRDLAVTQSQMLLQALWQLARAAGHADDDIGVFLAGLTAQTLQQA